VRFVFSSTYPGCPSTATGCHIDLHWVQLLPPSYPHGGNYLNVSDIVIVSAYQFSGPGAVTAAVAHEIGHRYGLHERYWDAPWNPQPWELSYPQDWPSSRCVPEVTIMDAMRLGSHCDGPAVIQAPDRTRVHDYWGEGRIDDWGVSWAQHAPGGPVAVWSWRDFAWAEAYEEIHIYRWNDVTSGWDWKTWFPHETNIAGHALASPGGGARTIDRRAAGPPWAPECFEPGWFMLAGQPWFESYNKYGTLTWDAEYDPVNLDGGVWYLGGMPC
jgi:hypothetical protein